MCVGALKWRRSPLGGIAWDACHGWQSVSAKGAVVVAYKTGWSYPPHVCPFLPKWSACVSLQVEGDADREPVGLQSD